MRLSDVLSKPLNNNFVQVEGFLDDKKLKLGKQKRIAVGKIGLTFFCKGCNDDRTFCSDDDLFCIGVNDHLISIDSALKCSCCDSLVQIWFLVISNEDIHSHAPNVRILKRSEKLSDTVVIHGEQFGNFTELLEKAQRAYREELGAGSIIYLRRVFEQITVKMAGVVGIDTKNVKGSRKAFKDLLREVDEKCSIIPKEFSENRYRLFSELSNVLHGDYDEQLGLQKYEAFRRLVVGIIDNVKNNEEMMTAITTLGWGTGDETHD